MGGTAENETGDDSPKRHAVDGARIAAAVSEILAAIGEDPGRVGLIDTPRRVAEAYAEFFSGVGVDARRHLADSIPVPGRTDADSPDSYRPGGLVLMRDIRFRSICEHHLLPFIGRCHIAYVPTDRLAGLGRLALVVDTLASRPQLQERLTEEIADVLDDTLSPSGVLVVMDAEHQCVTTRGPRQTQSSTLTIASRGSLADPGAQAAVLAMMRPVRDDGDA